MAGQNSCEYCSNYVYDEEYEAYECSVSMDEDDVAKLSYRQSTVCPYFSYNVEYKIVRKQL